VRRPDAAISSAVVLFVVYALTLAPDVTFWDAGEFISAAHALGVPHPPGTPLFILLANVWAKLLPLPFAAATNLLSAAATALAAAITARLIQRSTGSSAMAFAGAIAAGAMSTAWSNATETEVYAASLALGMLAIWAGERAGRLQSDRWLVLTAYLLSLAVPLHLSALVTAPVALVLATMTPEGPRWRSAVLLAGVFVLALGAGRMSWGLATVGAVIVAASSLRQFGTGSARTRALLPLATLVVVTVGCSVVMFMMVRAGLDPAVNQGNPDTLDRLAAVVSRRQYAVAPIWPRMAAPWVQLANLGQYADWQVALSTGPTVMPSLLRTLGTALFVGLAFVGGAWHWNADRRSWAGVATLLACGTLGVIVYLNLHAGPSIGFPGLAANAAREAREREYFFVFGFWAWGIWAGIGAVVMARQLSRPEWAGVLVAALPIVLNWSAVNRGSAAERYVPARWAEALLESTPERGVLFAAGDNDTYPLWYAQQAKGTRRDVAVVTLPLLATRWYRAELERRFGFTGLTATEYQGRLSAASAIADDARRQGRTVSASVMLMPQERARLAPNWSARGVVFVEGADGIDSTSTSRWASWIARELPIAKTKPALDPVTSYFRGLMDCPRQLTNAARMRDTSQLDSTCNYR
jgi:hypothetical protein